LEYLLGTLDRVLEESRRSRRLLVLSDFDGTLAPIVERPEMAELDAGTRQVLRRLAADARVTLGIVSGRALGDLKNKVGIAGLVYAGNHGLEIEGPGFLFVNPLAEQIKPVFRVLRQVLNMTAGSIKGVFVEDKGLSLSVHYRQAPEGSSEAVRQMVEHSIRGPLLSGLLKLTPGKKVLEVRPAVAWDKGRAIRLLMKRYGKGGLLSGVMPLYFGDDISDEDGFAVIEKYGAGITVHVGGEVPASSARFFLKSPQEVAFFLSKLGGGSPRTLHADGIRLPGHELA
jgi:trehalose 6-phosphate phosphatase